MIRFLDSAAAHLYTTFGSNLTDVTIVFPNRRAGIFFTKYLSEKITEPLFAPKIVTINELVSSFSENSVVADQVNLIIELYDVFKKITGSTESLDDFYYWGELMINDFNDIDKYLINAADLFRNIESLREIDAGFEYLSDEQFNILSSFWINLIRAKDSDSKQQFTHIWKNLYAIYVEFKKRLVERGIAYEGMLYRNMVDLLKDEKSKIKGDKFAVIGFNALNNCEKSLFDILKNQYKALFYWDYDEYYLSQENHEASMFLKTNLLRYPMPLDFVFDFNEFRSKKALNVISVPSFSGQANYVSEWLNDLNISNKNLRFDNTAVVLCDEELIAPLLNAIPPSISSYNITMGYPLKHSPVFGLLKSIIDVDKNSKRSEKDVLTFYHRNIVSLLNHQLIKPFIVDELNEIRKQIKNENKIYLTTNDLSGNELIELLINLPKEPEAYSTYFQKLIHYLFSLIPDTDQNIFEKESLYQFYLATTRLHSILFEKFDDKDKQLITKRLYFNLLSKQIEGCTVPFEGEPLSGLQIMGFLETRCLDFENLIVLSVNDSKLPGTSLGHSFIPYTLRKGFGLPVVEQKNAMYAYYFYRLIQRSSKTTLVYDCRTEGLNTGEISRFVSQLKYEASFLDYKQITASFDFKPTDSISISYPKTESVISKLVDYFYEKSMSPSALNNYIDCNLRFYFRYVAKINETDDVSEEIDNRVFGKIAHLTLEMLYKKFVGKFVSHDDMKRLSLDEKLISNCLHEALRKEYFKNDNIEFNGKNLLVYEIIKRYVNKVIQFDLRLAPFEIIGLEKEFKTEYQIENEQSKVVIRLGGTIDRIDKVNDRIRIVDYKTGESGQKVTNIASLFTGNYRNKAAFQTLLYSKVFKELTHEIAPINPAVYGARAVFTENFEPLIEGNDGFLNYQSVEHEFEAGLRNLLTEIFVSEKPFEQTLDATKCKFCSYSIICNRNSVG